MAFSADACSTASENNTSSTVSLITVSISSVGFSVSVPPLDVMLKSSKKKEFLLVEVCSTRTPKNAEDVWLLSIKVPSKEKDVPPLSSENTSQVPEALRVTLIRTEMLPIKAVLPVKIDVVFEPSCLSILIKSSVDSPISTK